MPFQESPILCMFNERSFVRIQQHTKVGAVWDLAQIYTSTAQHLVQKKLLLDEFLIFRTLGSGFK